MRSTLPPASAQHTTRVTRLKNSRMRRGIAAIAAWLRAASGWHLLVLLVCSGLLLLGSYQRERPIAINIGGAHEAPFVHNFHPKELADDRTSFRWTHATSFVILRGVGGERERLVTMRLRSGRPPGARQPVTVVINGIEAARYDIGADWQTVQAELSGAATAGHGIVVELRTTAEKLPNSGGKVVGVQVDEVRIATTGGHWTVPAWDTFGLMLLAIVGLYLVVFRALDSAGAARERARVYATLGGAAGALLLALLFATARPFIAAYDQTLFGIVVGMFFVLLLPGPLIRLGARLGLAVTRSEATALCAILALGIAVKLGGLLYPDTMVIDLPWHVKWQRELLRGQFAALYFPSELSSGPTEWGSTVRIPKSPLYYVAMAPIALLPISLGTGLKLAAGLLELTMVFFAYGLLKRIGRGAAGVVAAFLYTVTPLSYLILSFGSYPTLFAQFLTTLAFTVLLFAGQRLDHPGAFSAFVLILTLSLLAYPVVAVFNTCVLATFGLWRWWQATETRERRLSVLAPAGLALAALLAFFAYYIHHVQVTLASIRTLTGGTTQQPETASSGLFDAPGQILSVIVKNIMVGNLLILLVVAGAGAILMRRELAGEEARRTWQLLFLWLLILPVFVPANAFVELLLKPLFYTMLPVAMFGGITIVWLWQRSRWGQVAAIACCVAIAAQAWWLWFQRIAYAGQSLT